MHMYFGERKYTQIIWKKQLFFSDFLFNDIDKRKKREVDHIFRFV